MKAADSLSCLRVARSRLHEPHRSLGIVDAVPKPAAAGDLVLPLFHLLSVDCAAAEAPLQRVLSIGSLARISGQLLPGRPRVCGRGGADFVPALRRVARAEAEVPAVLRGRRSDPLPALRQGSDPGRSDGLADRLDCPAKPTSELRVRVYLCRRSPLSDELAQSLVVIKGGGGDNDPRELVEEQASITRWEELDPREGITESISEGRRAVDGEVAKRATDRRESVCALCLTVSATEPEVWFVPAAQEDVTLLDVVCDLVGFPQQVRERALDHSHVLMISELLQNSSRKTDGRNHTVVVPWVAMALAESSDPMRDLARTADAAARRVRPWQIGHELAKDLTADGRSMTPDEVALDQALERVLDWSGDGATRQFRASWLDEDTSLGEAHEAWPPVWASVADIAEHPTVVAHLSDLLWVVRHGTPHRHARARSRPISHPHRCSTNHTIRAVH